MADSHQARHSAQHLTDINIAKLLGLAKAEIP